MKQHGFNNSIVTSCKCPFELIHSHKNKLQNSKCVIVNKVGTILWLGHDNFTYTYFTHITTFKCELLQVPETQCKPSSNFTPKFINAKNKVWTKEYFWKIVVDNKQFVGM